MSTEVLKVQWHHSLCFSYDIRKSSGDPGGDVLWVRYWDEAEIEKLSVQRQMKIEVLSMC